MNADRAQCTLEILFLSGRLAFPPLLRQTLLTPRQLKHSLSVLIQENLVLWYTSHEDESTSYEANQDRCYLLIRSGKYLAEVEDRFEQPALGLVSHLIANGHTSVGALIQPHRSLDDVPAPKKLLRNGFKSQHADTRHAKDGRSVDSLQSALCDLLSTGLLQLAHESDFRPLAANKVEAEKLAPGHRDGLSVKMKQSELLIYNEDIANRLYDWKHGTEAQRAEISNIKGSKKRKIDSLSEKAEKWHRLSSESNLTKDDNIRV